MIGLSPDANLAVAKAYDKGRTDGATAERERIRRLALEHWRRLHMSMDPDYLPRWFAELMRDEP